MGFEDRITLAGCFAACWYDHKGAGGGMIVCTLFESAVQEADEKLATGHSSADSTTHMHQFATIVHALAGCRHVQRPFKVLYTVAFGRRDK